MSNVASLRPPSYRRHKASGQAVVTLGGRDVYLGKYGSAASKQQYRRLLAEFLLQGGVRSADASTTVIEVMAAYLGFAKGYYRKHGILTREYGLIVESCRFVKRLYGDSRAIDFGPIALQAVRQSMIEADHSRKYINKNIERVRRMFKWAAAEEMIPASIPQALAMVSGLRKGRTAARETAPILPVDDGVVDGTLPHLPAIVGDMVRVQRLTGMRPGEVCMLRPRDLDRSGDVWTYRPESHKTEHHGRERAVFIGPQAQAVLLRYLARDAEAFCFSPADSMSKHLADRCRARKTPVNCGNRPGSNRVRRSKRRAGDRYSAASYRRAIHRACDKAFRLPTLADLPPAKRTPAQAAELKEWQAAHRWAPNQLRHAKATQVRREFGLEAAQIILGHSHADVTEIYAERDLAKGREVARRLG